ncbi:hypothetical protein ACFORL_02515 [Legionella dresdenensis]|uniref:Polysaccharide biosynthesis protein n=1 Tax=Legionella dresdenensis TaxID=450200 RepID=A0ABV8CCC4_9GAMM
MLNILIQALTLGSGLLINFFIPLLFGLEKYGLFIKANILVFLFHKFTDVISEPLISNVDKKALLPVSFAVGAFVLVLFSCTNIFFSAGSPWLLASMVYSSSVLLVMYAQRLQMAIVTYLSVFIAIFIILLSVAYFNLYNITITEIIGITNSLPATAWLLFLLLNKKIEVSFNGIWHSVASMLRIIPTLFSLTLVSNLFTNILPFYLSFIFPPQVLGLFRVQVSIVQSVVAIFPVNVKAISAHFVQAESDEFLLEKMTRLSLNYFYLLAFVAYLFIGLYKGYQEFAQVFFILPVLHLSVILERYLLGIKRRQQLITINVIVSIFACIAVLKVDTLPQMILLYASGIAAYLMLMLTTISFRLKRMIALIALSAPLSVFVAMNSVSLGCLMLTACIFSVFALSPIDKNAISLLRK